MDHPERISQLSAPGLAASFPPLRTNAASPLETLGDPDDDLERRIDRAGQTLERRINERVADVLERALDAPFGKPGKDRKP
jgi:hypothetical protein